MCPSAHLSTSQLTLLSLALLLPLPHTVTSYPHSLSALLPRDGGPESALLRLQAALDGLNDAWFPPPTDPRRGLLEPGEEEEEEEEEFLLRSQRGELKAQPLSPFPASHSLESMSYQGGGEDGGRRNNALTFIAGGLQAVSREKGGFGFRFGRK
ncbi:uncharacterized protein LOC121524240 [Cheilinus undulatus]|uniref:uncharacterized protein LOC121524240 n=1 Tax=Cheilinus undulatus TaxID=241271 RepID=UPI001BD53EA6|nr:uncharacterized protein LOC121524240 [Cheilinus undulatus]